MPHHRRRADAIAVAALAGAMLGLLWFWFRHDAWLAEYDIMSYFLPWFGETGDRIGAGELPRWMPWLSAGSPLAGDPSGGWWYLPVMLPFAIFHVITAFKAMILIQTCIGGFCTYALGRLLGFRPASAFVAATSLALGPLLASQRMFGTVAGQASAWIPVAFVGIEMALRAPHWLRRVAWCGLAGLAISQIAVSWPGQGLLNALIFIGGWTGYRALLWPVAMDRPWRGRIVDAVVVGGVTLGTGLLLAAAGLLPRLAANAASNIPGGDYTGIVGGDYLTTPHSLATLLRDTLVDNSHSRPVALAAPVLVLAILAILAGRWRMGIPYFAAVTVIGCILTTGNTVVHEAFFLLPEFEIIHDHSPRRLIWVLFLAPSMLAGAGLESLLSTKWSPRTMPLLVIPLAIAIGAFLYLDRHDTPAGWWPVALALIVTALMLAVAAWPHRTPIAHAAVAGIVVLVVAFPGVIDAIRYDRQPGTASHEASADACLDIFVSRSDPGGAGAFLQQQAASGEIFRYAGYAGRDPLSHDSSYSMRRCNPAVLATLVGGRAVRLDLETIHGYNPLHLAAFTEFTDVMNGGPQDYHWMDPSPSALGGSPLFDMLNVRYIVVALDDSADPNVVAAIASGRVEVFRNDDVAVYENQAAFPRAWIVHEVRQDDGTALAQLQAGDVDGRTVAFVDGTIPPVAAQAGDESLTVTFDTEERRTAIVEASAPGLVVFSEIWDEGWHATVDGEPVETIRANRALVGVAVGAGAHTIELRYEPPGLRAGMWLSSLTGLAVIAAAGMSIMGSRGRNERSEPDSGAVQPEGV